MPDLFTCLLIVQLASIVAMLVLGAVGLLSPQGPAWKSMTAAFVLIVASNVGLVVIVVAS